jgi:glutathione synthase/RimK-type ligase-like ATP-grasp enzyme
MLQLNIAKEVGFNIPNTLITNNSESIKRFLQSNLNKRAVVKLIHHHRIDIGDSIYNFFCKEVDKKVLKKLSYVNVTPILIQSKVPILAEIRITIVGDKIFATQLKSKGDTYSDIHSIDEHNLLIKDLDLDKLISNKCMMIMEKLGLIISSIDLAVDIHNNVYFFEINPVGDWYWMENKTGSPITQTVCDLLKHKIKTIR